MHTSICACRAKPIQSVQPVNQQGSSPRSPAGASAAFSTSMPLSMVSCTASEDTGGLAICKAPHPHTAGPCCNPRSSSEVSSAADGVSLAALSTCILPGVGSMPSAPCIVSSASRESCALDIYSMNLCMYVCASGFGIRTHTHEVWNAAMHKR